MTTQSQTNRVLCLWVIALTAVATSLVAQPALIPLPQQMVTNAGTFVLCPPQAIRGVASVASTRILVDEAARSTGEYLALTLFKSTGYRFEVATNSGGVPVPQAIVITTNGALPGLGVEGYELTVETNSVVIRAPAAAGLFYGAQTFLQLLPPEVYSSLPVTTVQWTAPCVYIQDTPRFPWRGFMLDSVRHFWNVDEVKQLIDGMTIHKLNTLHWHLDDDSGWRIEILKYPLLTLVGAWRTDTNAAGAPLWNLNPRSSTAWREDGMYGGYYSQAQVREIVAYAAQRHITIVPEIEMPGHSTAALSAYPQFSCGWNGECGSCSNVPYSLNVTSYVGGVFCIARPETMTFLQDVLTEVMDLFPSQYIHIGGDEVRFTNWLNHPLDQQAMINLGYVPTTAVTNLQKYQSHFTQQIANWLKSQGRTMMGWSEIMNGGTVTNASLMDWLNTRAVQAATNGQPVVMAPSATLYINKWETATNASGGGVVWSNEPPGQSGLCTLSNVYVYEPVPAALPAAFTNLILGASGPCWTEWIPSLKNMQFRMFPRLCAIAELDWTRVELKNWTDFTNRLEFHKRRLEHMGINYNPHRTPPAIGQWTPAQMSTNYTVLEWPITSSVTNAGEISVSFCWKSGSHGLDIAWAALLQNGFEIDRDTHAGFTGATPVRPVYVLRLPAFRPGASYTLRALVASRGGTNSTGVIYRPNWN
ncbi:MAG TPA: beta-N-acetylhexosaminidase [Verrucomicrobiae bacterium]|nr:beta-N-acetylhexosaminidase [Verrucomicrobiae bacterium]